MIRAYARTLIMAATVAAMTALSLWEDPAVWQVPAVAAAAVLGQYNADWWRARALTRNHPARRGGDDAPRLP